MPSNQRRRCRKAVHSRLSCLAWFSGSGSRIKFDGPSQPSIGARDALVTQADEMAATPILTPHHTPLIVVAIRCVEAIGETLNHRKKQPSKHRRRCDDSISLMKNLAICHRLGSHLRLLLPLLIVSVMSSSGAAGESASDSAGAWSATGSMQDERWWFTMTTLLNGKVLAAAGYSYETYDLATAELYDSATGTWSRTGSLRNARFSHTATLRSEERRVGKEGRSGGAG